MKIIYELSEYVWMPVINDPDPPSCSLNVYSDDNILIIEPINPPLEYKLITRKLNENELSRLTKLTYTITDSNGVTGDPQYEYFLVVKRASSAGSAGITDPDKFVLKEDLVYHDILLTTPYNKTYKDIFNTPDSLDTISNLVYDEDTTSYSGTNGSYFSDTPIDDDTNTYDNFMIHIEAENSNYSIEYSTDNGTTWIPCNPDENIHTDNSYNRLRIKVTLTGDNTIYSYGVFYDK